MHSAMHLGEFTAKGRRNEGEEKRRGLELGIDRANAKVFVLN